MSGSEQLAKLNLTVSEHILIIRPLVNKRRFLEEGDLVFLILLDDAVLKIQTDIIFWFFLLLPRAIVWFFVDELLRD